MCIRGKKYGGLVVRTLAVCFSWFANLHFAQAEAHWVPQVLPVELQVGYAVRSLDLNGDDDAYSATFFRFLSHDLQLPAQTVPTALTALTALTADRTFRSHPLVPLFPCGSA